MRIYLALVMLGMSQVANANDWEKFYRPNGNTIDQTLPSTSDPEVVASTGDFEHDMELMYRKGFAPIGFTSFNSPNSKTDDAIRLAKKLQAQYLIMGTNLVSTRTVALPLTLPNTTTSTTNGTVSAYGRGGYANGTYSGTTTTYGSSTTYIPMTVNRFRKEAIYFRQIPKMGIGIATRDLTTQEISVLETRRAIAVRFVRDNSPAYLADVLPGDIFLQINGQPVDLDTLKGAARGPQPFTVHLIRNGKPRDISISVPADWQSQ